MMPCEYCTKNNLSGCKAYTDDYGNDIGVFKCYQCDYTHCYEHDGSSYVVTACDCCHRDFCLDCEATIEKRETRRCDICIEECDEDEVCHCSNHGGNDCGCDDCCSEDYEDSESESESESLERMKKLEKMYKNLAEKVRSATPQTNSPGKVEI